MTKYFLILFLFFSVQSSLNESKDATNTSEHHLNYANQSFFSLLRKGSPFFYMNKDVKAIVTKRLQEQKIAERNVLCSHLKHLKCSNLPPECLTCNFNLTCVYGTQLETTCRPHKNYSCEGQIEFTKNYTCAYCYQLPESNYTCTKTTSCKPHSRYLTNCTVDKKVLCLGNRKFNKFTKCKLKSNIKWNYALIFSITLGGFGIDRFYLGNWQEGFGKLFSFGGLGFWTLIDVILIWVGYLKPVDGNYS